MVIVIVMIEVNDKRTRAKGALTIKALPMNTILNNKKIMQFCNLKLVVSNIISPYLHKSRVLTALSHVFSWRTAPRGRA